MMRSGTKFKHVMTFGSKDDYYLTGRVLTDNTVRGEVCETVNRVYMACIHKDLLVTFSPFCYTETSKKRGQLLVCSHN